MRPRDVSHLLSPQPKLLEASFRRALLHIGGLSVWLFAVLELVCIVEVLLYKKAPSFPLRPGRLGCATRSKDDGRMLTGSVALTKD
eukprot:1178431-Amphidinium_carterae.1